MELTFQLLYSVSVHWVCSRFQPTWGKEAECGNECGPITLSARVSLNPSNYTKALFIRGEPVWLAVACEKAHL